MNLNKLGIASLISGIIAFTSSWSWLFVNASQPNHSSSDTIDEDQQRDMIQNYLTIGWLVGTLLTITLVIVVLQNRRSPVDNLPNPDTPDYSGKLIFAAIAFILTSVHFIYIFMVLMLDIIFRGV